MNTGKRRLSIGTSDRAPRGAFCAFISALTAVTMLMPTAQASAQEPRLPEAPPDSQLPSFEQPSSDEALDNWNRAERAQMNFGRGVVEVLLGAAVGTAASFFAVYAYCGFDLSSINADSCNAGLSALLIAGVSTFTVPIGVTLAGDAMGGAGNYGVALLGSLVALLGAATAAGADDDIDDETSAESSSEFLLALTISNFLAPITSAFIYEFFSHTATIDIRAGVSLGPSGEMAGGTLAIAGHF